MVSSLFFCVPDRYNDLTLHSYRGRQTDAKDEPCHFYLPGYCCTFSDRFSENYNFLIGHLLVNVESIRKSRWRSCRNMPIYVINALVSSFLPPFLHFIFTSSSPSFILPLKKKNGVSLDSLGCFTALLVHLSSWVLGIYHLWLVGDILIIFTVLESEPS